MRSEFKFHNKFSAAGGLQNSNGLVLHQNQPAKTENERLKYYLSYLNFVNCIGSYIIRMS